MLGHLEQWSAGCTDLEETEKRYLQEGDRQQADELISQANEIQDNLSRLAEEVACSDDDSNDHAIVALSIAQDICERSALIGLPRKALSSLISKALACLKRRPVDS